MKLSITNQDLLEIERQINMFPLALRLLLKGRINDFMDMNGIRLKTLKEKVGKLQEDYFEMEENNGVKTVKTRKKIILTEEELKMPPEQVPLEHIMKEGKKLQDYLDEQGKIMKNEIEIIF